MKIEILCRLMFLRLLVGYAVERFGWKVVALGKKISLEEDRMLQKPGMGARQ